MARQGFMLYHEDCSMLKYASDAELASIMRGLIEFSIGLEESGEIPHVQSDNGMIQALFNSMVQKILRDNGKYNEAVREQSIKRKIGHLQDAYKVKGIKKSKAEIRLEAEAWYSSVYHGTPGNSNSNVTVTRTQSETVSPSVTQPLSLSVAPAVAQAEAEAPTAELQSLIDEAQRRGVRVNDRVMQILSAELTKNSAEEVTRKFVLEPNFLVRLKMIGGM